MNHRILPTLVFATLASLVTSATAEPDTQLYENLPPLPLPDVDPDVLAQGSSLRMVAGNLDFVGSGRTGDDDDTESVTYSLALSTRYFRSLERTSLGAT